jgi:hypothetical protein
MTTNMIELVSDHRSHGLSGLSLSPLEGTLVAASLLLDAWRTTTRSDLKRAPESPSLKENSICP